MAKFSDANVVRTPGAETLTEVKKTAKEGKVLFEKENRASTRELVRGGIIKQKKI